MKMWGADRMDHMDSKSMQPGETPGHLAIFLSKIMTEDEERGKENDSDCTIKRIFRCR